MNKKKIIITGVALFVLIAAGIIFFMQMQKNYNQNGDNIKTENKINDKSIVYTITGFNDYRYLQPKDLYRESELVVIGMYDAYVKSYASLSGNPITVSKFKIEEVLKGNIKISEEGFINISYLGGTITLEEYIKTQTQEQLQKKGLDTIDSAYTKNKLIEYIDYEAPIELINGTKYMLFLNYDEDNETYAAHANGYGILKMNSDGYIYSHFHKEYLKVDFYE